MKLYIGIDWSQSKHDICFVNTKGVIQSQLVIPHSQTGFWEFEQRRKKLGVSAEDCLVVYRFKGFGHFVMETFATLIDYIPAI